MRFHLLARPIFFLPVLALFFCMGRSSLYAIDGGSAGDQAATPSVTGEITREDRIDILRTFTADLIYIRTTFPMGRTGLTVKDGKVTPSGNDLQQLLTLWGPSVKPGDQALITTVSFSGDRIRFEINGGPIKKKKWYQHIEVGMGDDTSPIAPSDSNANPRGSYVDLVFSHHLPDVNAKKVQELLAPVFDFDAKSALEAYLETMPPKVKEAIKAHDVLVGMNREMVIYSKGLAPKKIREKDDQGTEYEEWIYGEPPQDVSFIRFVGDEVIRVENMKVDGTKVVKTEKEVDLSTIQAASASNQQSTPSPTLRRPGESAPPQDSPQLPHPFL